MENWAGEQDCDLTFIYFPGEYNLVLDICCYCSWQVKNLRKKRNLKKSMSAFRAEEQGGTCESAACWPAMGKERDPG